MSGSKKQPRWIEPSWVDAIHTAQIQAFGGSYGKRDAALIESAVMRPRQYWNYIQDITLSELAAITAVGLARNHGYVDGNKRVAFVSMNIFLELNGYILDVPETEVVSVMAEIAGGTMTEQELSEWISDHIHPA